MDGGEGVTVRPQAQMLLFSFFLVFLCVGFLSLLPSQGVLCFFYRGSMGFFLGLKWIWW